MTQKQKNCSWGSAQPALTSQVKEVLQPNQSLNAALLLFPLLFCDHYMAQMRECIAQRWRTCRFLDPWHIKRAGTRASQEGNTQQTWLRPIILPTMEAIHCWASSVWAAGWSGKACRTVRNWEINPCSFQADLPLRRIFKEEFHLSWHNILDNKVSSDLIIFIFMLSSQTR